MHSNESPATLENTYILCMDAALQKLSDIQCLLSSCAELLAASSAGIPPTVPTRTTDYILPSNVATDIDQSPAPRAPVLEPLPPDDNNALRDGGETLAHYIVRLESELGYYKYLCNNNNSAQESRPYRQTEQTKAEAQYTPTETAESGELL